MDREIEDNKIALRECFAENAEVKAGIMKEHPAAAWFFEAYDL